MNNSQRRGGNIWAAVGNLYHDIILSFRAAAAVEKKFCHSTRTIENETGVVNDPLGWSELSEDLFVSLDFEDWRRTDGQTDVMCEYS